MAERGVGGIGISPARRTAYSLLRRVATTEAHSDDLLHAAAMERLSQADKNLTTALVLGVLRWQIALDAQLVGLLARPEAPVADDVVTALRLGAFQLLHMDRIPAHAAIGESVELAKAAGHANASGMVNAVLRKLAAAGPAKKKLVETTGQMAERLGHPAWMVARWVKQYGRAAAEAVCGADQQPPVAGRLFAAEEGLGTMDDGSRLVAELAAAAAPSARRVWDACAAPGGKTLVLAARLKEAEILATDASPRRLKAMAARVEHVGRIRCEVADALTKSDGEFDLILCDVPCSGTGTLGRNPEIRHRLVPEEIPRQARRQREILKNALARLAPGGRLVYSTCSLEVEECEQVVEAVTTKAAGVRRVDVTGLVTGLVGEAAAAVVRDGCLRTLPGCGFEGDGFYAAVLERV